MRKQTLLESKPDLSVRWPCVPNNHAKRSVAAIIACLASKSAGAPTSAQQAAGDAVYCGKSLADIESAVVNAGGTQSQGEAAAMTVDEQLDPLDPRRAAAPWWPLGDGRFDHIVQANKFF